MEVLSEISPMNGLAWTILDDASFRSHTNWLLKVCFNTFSSGIHTHVHEFWYKVQTAVPSISDHGSQRRTSGSFSLIEAVHDQMHIDPSCIASLSSTSPSAFHKPPTAARDCDESQRYKGRNVVERTLENDSGRHAVSEY